MGPEADRMMIVDGFQRPTVAEFDVNPNAETPGSDAAFHNL